MHANIIRSSKITSTDKKNVEGDQEGPDHHSKKFIFLQPPPPGKKPKLPRGKKWEIFLDILACRIIPFLNKT